MSDRFFVLCFVVAILGAQVIWLTIKLDDLKNKVERLREQLTPQ